MDSLVRTGLQALGDRPVGEDVGDLADGPCLAARLYHSIEHRRLRRRDGVVVPVRGAGVGARLAGEGPRDDPADPHRRGQPEGGLAGLVEALEPERLLVGRDLEDAVGGGVADGPASPHALLAQLRDDGGAGRVPIAENAGQPCVPDQRLGQFPRKAGLGLREVVPREGHRLAGDLPVAGGRVLALAPLAHHAPERVRLARRTIAATR